ncbi:C40 family peptidase [Lysobacter arvi]|uniref:C40 family peptidase n=1 Tax=Lysobacter arvi TaxID=3038776 RepID=A0ABU1CC47_9GAMM|nr:C40 family peptidase [Lysobacter arvi]MDR0182763.1 C40 family peptidase [Lysobacter arvi]
MPVTPAGPCAAPTFRHRSLTRFAIAAALALSAVPAFAQQMPSSSLAGDSADAPAPVARTTLPEAMSLSDRTLLLATDMNRALVPAASAGETVAQLPAQEQGKIKTVLQRAMALLGTPYRWGGSDPSKGFDCSGLVGYVFRNALGIELPRVSREMAKTGELINDRAKLNAGDLVFFGRRGRVDHVGIYVGEGRFVHAPSRGKDVQVSELDGGYWGQKFIEARRVDGI